MPVALADLSRAIGLGRSGPGTQPCRVGPQSHGSAQVRYVPLRVHEGDDRCLAVGLEFSAVGVGEPADVASKLDNGHLKTEANPEEGQIVLPGPPNGLDHPADSSFSEAARNQESIVPAEEP